MVGMSRQSGLLILVWVVGYLQRMMYMDIGRKDIGNEKIGRKDIGLLNVLLVYLHLHRTI